MTELIEMYRDHINLTNEIIEQQKIIISALDNQNNRYRELVEDLREYIGKIEEENWRLRNR